MEAPPTWGYQHTIGTERSPGGHFDATRVGYNDIGRTAAAFREGRGARFPSRRSPVPTGGRRAKSVGPHREDEARARVERNDAPPGERRSGTGVA